MKIPCIIYSIHISEAFAPSLLKIKFSMAEAAVCLDFGDWLSNKLEQLSIDQDVFGSYISSIVETDDSNEEEKSEALTGILGEILVQKLQYNCVVPFLYFDVI